MVVWKSLSKRRSLKLTRSRRYKSRRPKSRNVRLVHGKRRRRSRARGRKTHTRHRRQRGGNNKQFLSNVPRSLGGSFGGYLDPAIPGAIAQATHAPLHTYKKCGSLL